MSKPLLVLEDLAGHPDIIRLAAEYGCPPAWLDPQLLRLFTWYGYFCPDDDAPSLPAAQIDDITQLPSLARFMVQVGLLKQRSDGLLRFARLREFSIPGE